MFRLIRGADCYWAVGQSRVARVPLSGVAPDGTLTQSTATRIEHANLSPAPDPSLYHMTVVVTTKCNLACSYCFQNVKSQNAESEKYRIGNAAARIPAAAVDEDMVAQILAFGRRQMDERNAHKLDLVLFGGEPTLYLDQCLRLLDGASQLGLARASMISNATRLGLADAVALERAGLQSVQVTLDGDAPVHDRLRITPGGRGTFEKIIDNLEQAASATTLRWLLRINLTGDSIETADALLDRLAGRLEPSSFDINFALVSDFGVGFADAIEPSSALARRVSMLYLRAMEFGFNVRPPMLKQCLACDAFGGATGAVINAEGTLYSCWGSVGKEGYAVGTISEGYAPDDVIRSRWVACGFDARGSLDPMTLNGYNEAVNATILDWLHAAGRLQQVPVKVAADERDL